MNTPGAWPSWVEVDLVELLSALVMHLENCSIVLEVLSQDVGFNPVGAKLVCLHLEYSALLQNGIIFILVDLDLLHVEVDDEVH